MTIDEVLNSVGNATTDDSGHIANFIFKRPGLVGHLAARLDKSAGPSVALWRIVWIAHWRTDRGQEERDTSTDLRGLLGRFGPIDISGTPALALDDLTK